MSRRESARLPAFNQWRKRAPLFGADGNLYYIEPTGRYGRMMTLRLPEGTADPGVPEEVFEIEAPSLLHFDLTRDGQRFLMVRTEESLHNHLEVAFGWRP